MAKEYLIRKRLYFLYTVKLYLFTMLFSLIICNVIADELHVGESQAYATISDAYGDAESGDEIIIHPGHYYDDIQVSSNFTISITGSTLDPTDVIWESNSTSYDPLRNNGDCTVSNVTICNGDYWCILIQGGTCTIINCIVEDSGMNGINSLGGSDVYVEDCIVRDNARDGIYIGMDNGDRGGHIENTLVYNNGFINAGTTGYGIRFLYGTSDVINCTVVDNENGITWGSNEPDIINSIVYYNQYNQLSGSTNEDVTYSDIEGGYTGVGNINVDPEFVDRTNDNYHIKWGSPCIDSGSITTPLDDDYSRADMGSYPYERDEFIFDTSARYHWHCFPRMNVSDEVNNGESDDYLCPDDCMDEFWDVVPSVIVVNFSSGNVTTGTNYEDNLVWSDIAYQFFSFNGFKFSCGSDSRFFIGGYLMDPDYVFDDLSPGVENWLGYFLEESQFAFDAISSSVTSKLLQIKTQRWSLNRSSTKQPWPISAGSNYIINYGDLVILKPSASHTITGFQWQQPRGAVEPYIRPRAEHFDWEDEIDYLPVFVEFSPDNVPLEVAVYVNDVCKGAQVVEDTLCQICAYILEEEPGAEIEFAFYDGDRNMTGNDFLVLDNSTGEVKGNKIVTGTPGDFYRISFSEDQYIPPTMKYNLHAEPNPFNPSTNICFELEEESNVSLNIYNCKGQRVKTLADETFRPGEYSLHWDGKNETGKMSGSGVYFLKMACGNDVVTGKIIMLK